MQLIVDAKDVKQLFSNLRPIMRTAVDGGLMGFHVSSNVLTVTCKNGIIYEQKFACDTPETMSVTAIYRDIAELLPRRGQVQMVLSEKSVFMKAAGFSTTLLAAYGEVTPYTRRVVDYKPCKADDYTRLAQTFQELNPVAKSLKRESSVILRPPHAICKYPTIWLETVFRGGLTTSIGVKELRTIANFRPTYFGVTKEAVEFVNSSAMMAFPVNPVDEIKTCKQILLNPGEPNKLYNIDAYDDVQAFVRTVHGACKLSFYSDGYSVQYKNQEVEMALNIGDCVGVCYYTLDTYTEYLMMFFHVMTVDAYLVKADNAVMIEVPEKLRLLHSII